MNKNKIPHRVGVLTGGGDCPGLNAVIRSIVKTGILKYNMEIIGLEDGFEGLLRRGKTRRLYLKDVKGLLVRGGDNSRYDKPWKSL